MEKDIIELFAAPLDATAGQLRMHCAREALSETYGATRSLAAWLHSIGLIVAGAKAEAILDILSEIHATLNP